MCRLVRAGPTGILFTSLTFFRRNQKIDPGFGIDAVALAAVETNALTVRQVGLDGGVDNTNRENTAKLVDRLGGRLGVAESCV